MRLHTVLLGFLLAVGGSADLHSKVRHFETLSSSDLNVVSRKKRSVDGSFSHVKQISFNTLGRRFSLVLYPGSPVIGPNFKARTVDRDGRVETFDVNPNNFYTGHLADDSSISVNAHFEDGILSSSIQFPHDTYVVEPAWRHSLPSENQTMISYRGSDVNWEDIYPIDPKTGKRTRMKDGIRLFQKTSAGSERPYRMNESSVDTSDKSRHKRSVGKNTCPLILVADYTFFRDMGNSKRQTTAAFIISSFQAVNQRYRRTVWDSYSGYVNMGFTIDEMLIHTSFSKNPGHYNSDMSWGYNDKLYAFGRMNRLNHFCLGHLFTSYAFPDNVLGLAFIAPESVSSAGGICSVTTTVEGALLYPRCGWSSARNSRNIPVLSLQYELVTTHELGHNWGAEHDPDTSECAPSSHNNGKYLMWPYSVPGYDDNNQYFSPCSKRYIAPVLRAKSDYCFREFVEKVTNKTDSSSKSNKTDSSTQTDIRPLCGNGRIEKGEECDIGFTEDDAEDNCCDKKCHLKPGAQCSEFNFPCCTKDCKIAGSDIRCEDRNNLTCKDASFCDGKGLDCPAAGALEDDTPCIDKGLCWQGRCLDFCALIGRKIGKVMTPCLCTQNATAMCRRCCAERNLDNTKGHCLPTKEMLDNGRTCHMGTCNDKGVCIKVEQQLAQRIFSFIKDLTVDKLVEFMKTNIVGTVIVLSLIIWIPASCIVSAVDKRKIVEEENDVLRWALRENAIIGRSREDLANFRIKNSRFTRVPQPAQRNGGVEDLHQRIRNSLQHHLELKGIKPPNQNLGK